MAVVNEQWELTDDALQGRGRLSYYIIAASRLTEDGSDPFGKVLYDWPIQMARKANFDYDQFVEAYRSALRHFAGRYAPPLDSAKLEASIEKGQEFARAKHREFP